MHCRKIVFLVLLVCGWLSAVAGAGDPPARTYAGITTRAKPFVPVINYYLLQGDKAYARKEGYTSYRQALSFYDTANAIAQRLNDTALLAETTFALGRVYDGWNKKPQRTIELYRQTVAFMKAKSNDTVRYYYASFLLAHAYAKTGDTAATLRALSDMLNSLEGQGNTFLQQLPFSTEMAFSAAELGANQLANTILNTLTRREWIANDTATFDYLNRYYLTRVRLDMAAGKKVSPFLDSFVQVCIKEEKPAHKAYYAEQLSLLYKQTGQYNKAYQMLSDAVAFRNSTQGNIDGILLYESLVRAERQAFDRKQEYKESLRTTRTTAFWILGSLLVIISLLGFYFFQRGRLLKVQSGMLQETNAALDHKIKQVEILNLEREHRTKNNLYILQSLLQMQSRQANTEELAQSLQVAETRVQNMALLNSMLTKGANAESFKNYVTALMKQAIQSYSGVGTVDYELDMQKGTLPEPLYVPLSLILNEWVTNSVKYAKPTDGRLKILFSLYHNSDSINVVYFDNGTNVSLPTKEEEGIGSQVIRILTAQINATLTQAQPFHYHIHIPYER